MAASVYKICSCRPAKKLKCRHSWWFSFKRRGIKERIRKSLDVVLEKRIDSKTIAEEEANRLRNGIIDDSLPKRTRELLGLPASMRPALEALTVRQLLNNYRERHLTRTATVKKQTYQIEAVTRTVLVRVDGERMSFGDWLAADVTADTIERLREARTVRSIVKHAKGVNRVGGATAANRDLQLLRAAFNWALRTGYIERTPFKRAGEPVVRLTGEMARSRRLQAGEEGRLFREGGTHLKALVEAALETGCRLGELLSLQWHQVQFDPRPELWLPAGKTKTGKARRVPISTRMKAVLEGRRESLRKTMDLQPDEPLEGEVYVFGNDIGQPVGSIKTAWKLTCARAEIYELHFHDLRREAGSRWMEAGVPLATIQRWLGHTNISQTSTYLSTTTHGEHEAMRRFEERLGRLTPIDTEVGTPPRGGGQSDTMANNSPRENTK